MSHMVIYRSSDGKPGYQQIDQLEEAIRFVERLRNEQGVTDAKLFDLVEVPISFKAYYQVEVGSPAAPAAVVEPNAEPAPSAPSAPSAPAPAADQAKPVAQPAVAVQPAKSTGPAPVAASASANGNDDKSSDASANGGRFGLFGKS